MDSSKRPCFLAEDDGLASLADMEAGYSGYNNHNHNHHHHHHQHGFVSRTMGYAASFNRTSLRSLSVSSPRSGRFYDARFEDQQPHFLDACFLCKKPLANDMDIFMYRLATRTLLILIYIYIIRTRIPRAIFPNYVKLGFDSLF